MNDIHISQNFRSHQFHRKTMILGLRQPVSVRLRISLNLGKQILPFYLPVAGKDIELWWAAGMFVCAAP